MAHRDRLQNSLLQQLRSWPLADVPSLLGFYCSKDREYEPIKYPGSERLYVTVDGGYVHEIVVTGERFIGTKGEKRGGGGAIDLTLYLHGWEPSKFRMAVARLLAALHAHGLATQAATGEWVIADPGFGRSE